jgi:MOSC domain-containing protein YiiM
VSEDCQIRVSAIFLSPGHNFFGRYGHPAARHPIVEVEEVECVAGRGLVGDRFFDFKPDYCGQITFFAEEVYRDLCRALGIHDKPRSVFRRNVLTEGVDLQVLVGRRFSLQGIEFEGAGECSPCLWMNEAFGCGAEEFLRGRGGLRARILGDGVLRKS